MAIKEPLMFITLEEFKNSKYFNELLFDKVTTPDNEIWFAISVASSNIDYLSGFIISKKWPEINPTDFTDNIQTATTNYVRFLLTKDVDYLRGQGSISQGGLTYSETNPDDPYFIPPEVFNYLRNIKEYIAFKGFDIDVSSKNNYYQTYFGNGGHNNLLELYLVITNLFSSDPRVKIKQIHKQNIQGTLVDIDTSAIKSIDNLKTNELFTKYFSNDSMQLVDGKQGQQSKVISISDEVGKLIESKQSQLTSDNAGDNIIITGSGKNIKINSTGGGSSKPIISSKHELLINENAQNIDINFAEHIEQKINDIANKVSTTALVEKLKLYATQVDLKSVEDLFTTALTNLVTKNNLKVFTDELKELEDRVKEDEQHIPTIPQWKEVGEKVNINHIKYTFKSNTKYKIYYNFESQTSIKKFSFICKEFLYGELNTDVQTFDWDKVNDRIMVSLQMQNNTIYVVSDPARYGQLLKLEELQE